MSAISDALLAELDDEAFARLAERLLPHLAARGNGVQDGWLRGADKIADYIDAPRSRVYALVSAGRIPIEKDGSSLIAHKSDLDAWVRNGGAKRP